MRNIFFDTNVIIDWLVSKSINHDICTKAIDLSFSKSRSTFLSPTTIAFTYYFLCKQYKSEKKVKSLSQSIFKPFRITMENESIVRMAMDSHFNDIEDAIQYFSAQNTGVDVIVTQNTHDFIHSKIAVLSPEEFCRFWEDGITNSLSKVKRKPE